MEHIKTIEQFKKFMQDNYEVIKANVIRIDNIPIDDEWMQDDIWDEIYQNELKNNKEIKC